MRRGWDSELAEHGTGEAEAITTALRASRVTRLHRFGVKTLGLARDGHPLTSADSPAWSVAARRAARWSGCSRHRNCANSLPYALPWRQQLLAQLRRSTRRGEELSLFIPTAGPADGGVA